MVASTDWGLRGYHGDQWTLGADVTFDKWNKSVLSKGRTTFRKLSSRPASDLLKTGVRSVKGIWNWKFWLYHDKVYHAGSDSSGRWGCRRSVSPGPTGSEAENVFPAGTRVHPMYIDTDSWPWGSQMDARGVHKTQAAPVASSCSPLRLSRMEDC